MDNREKLSEFLAELMLSPTGEAVGNFVRAPLPNPPLPLRSSTSQDSFTMRFNASKEEQDKEIAEWNKILHPERDSDG